MSKKPLTISQFFKQFPDDETCLKHLFETRFGQGFECPKCERPSNWYRIKAERAYSCQWCGHHLHVTVGTPFEKTRTPLQLWFYAMFLFTTTRHGVSAKELQRQLGVTYKTAWRMGHEIRKHMAAVDGDKPIGGEGKTVQIDETMVGGVMHVGYRGRHIGNKTFVLGMVENGGDVVTKIIPDVKRATLFPLIEANVAPGTTIHTDTLGSYRGLSLKGYRHQTVNHTAKEYVSAYGATTNSIESFWAILQRGIAGTHIYVSGKHLSKYTGEFEYRFNRRERAETMIGELLSTFRPLS
ncbi:MAG: IS1595 family transposase [Sphingosinicella sp.]|nr:IS1595 family transposase [Sphingosinicella sp.]